MVVDSNQAMVLKTGVSYTPVNPDLNFRLRLDIGGANIRIADVLKDEETGHFYVDRESGLDMDFEVIKYHDKPGSSTIKIWNLSDSTYTKIMNEADAFELYGAWSNDEYCLITRGYPEALLKKAGKTIKTANQGFLKQDANAGRRGQNDLETTIKLVDGKVEYEEAFLNKTYYGEVSTELILNDLIETLGVPIGTMAPIEHHTVFGMVYKDKSVKLLNNLGKLLNFSWTILNGVFYLFTEKGKNETYGIFLNSQNSATPERQNDKFKTTTETIQKANKKKGIKGVKKTSIETTYNGYMIKTRLIPFLNPGTTCFCDFGEKLQGSKFIYKVIHRGNNYGTVAETEVYIV